MKDYIPLVPAAVFAAGVSSHLVYFRRGEHHLHGMRYALIAISTFISSIVAQRHFLATPVWAATTTSSYVASCYLAGLYTSLIIYRVFFHRLRAFPGPLGCKISSVWFTTYVTKQDAFRQLKKLHDQHGHFLRVGSNDLSISHPKAVQAIYGLGSKCSKAGWYDLNHPMVSLHTTRDKSLHDQRRRLWSGAFGDRNVRDYESRTVQYRTLLVKAIENAGSQPIDMAKWFNMYTFDVMGDLAFGKSFHMLETGKEHGAITLLNGAVAALGLMLPTWFTRLITEVPGLTRDWWKFIGFCVEQIEHRMQTKVETPDITSWLLKPLENKTVTKLDRAWLHGDSELIIVAGSDTTSVTLTSIFKYLAEQPDHIDALRKEIDPISRTEEGDYLPPDLADLDHLNGVINEALRLYPPVPSAVQRLTPPEGLTVDGTFIPGNTTVYCPQYVIGRDPNCFVKPDEFIPERWYSRPDLMPDSSGYAPFTLGTYGCIGKPFALVSIRGTVARIIADYDVRLPPGGGTADYEDGLRDHFTLGVPPLNLCFSRRGS